MYGRRGHKGMWRGEAAGGHGFGRRRHRDAGTLAGLRAGMSAVITTIDDDTARAQALRFGMGHGARVRCMTVLPAGPVVIRSGRQEIAIGRGLARRIGIADIEAV